MRWGIRMSMELQQAWSAARRRLKELGSPEAWHVVVEASWRQLESMIADMGPTDAAEAARLQRKHAAPAAANSAAAGGCRHCRPAAAHDESADGLHQA